MSGSQADAGWKPFWQDVPALDCLLVHCQGEIGKVIMRGAPDIPGRTPLERMNHLNTVDDAFRRFVTFDPRAHQAMSVNLLVPPSLPDADAGFIVLQSDRAHAMSGSNCMCVVTALLESGRVPMRSPETIVRLDTPAGLVVARAECRDGRCLRVSLDNVPCYAEQLDMPVETPQWGRIHVDIAFGGIFYALIDVEQIGLDIVPEQAGALARAGAVLLEQIAQLIHPRHPERAGVEGIAYVMFRKRLPGGIVRTCTTLPPGRVDRSPCGTGSSANLASLFARGEIRPGEHLVSRSINGGRFEVALRDTVDVAGRTAVLPTITGNAFVYGREQLWMRDDDPFPAGFQLSDTWGG